MHAMVRAAMSRRDDWNFDEWDHPLNQVQLAATLWRYVGLLMGVHPE